MDDSVSRTGRQTLTTPPASDDGGSLNAYLEVVRRWRRSLALAPLIVGVVTGIVSLLLPRYYVARSSFVAQEPTPTRSGMGALAATFGIPQLSALVAGGTTTSPQFYADLVQSRELLLSVATSTYTISTPRRFSGTLVQYFKPREKTEEERELWMLKRLRNRVMSVQLDRTTGIVRVDVRTTSKDLSAQVGRRLLTLLNDFNLRRRQGQLAAEREFTERRANDARAELYAAEDALAAFARSNRQYSASPDLATQHARLLRRVDMAQQLYSTLSQQYELARVESVRNTPVVTVIDSPESLVEPEPRYTLLKMAIAFAATFIAVLVVALARERNRVQQAPIAGEAVPHVTREPTLVAKKRPEATTVSA